MTEVKAIPIERFGRGFIPEQYLPEGKDEYYLRNEQSPTPSTHWRSLRASEIETLVKNGNTCENWNETLVRDPFDPRLIKNCEFVGLVRIGQLGPVVLEHHDLQVPVGITESLIIACDIGDNCAIHQVRYLSHFVIGDNVILLNIDEMNTTNHAKFGNGIVKQGEDEKVRITLDLMNEAGGRAVMPFDGMIAADAYLWAKFRDDEALMQRFGQITQETFDARRGYYGTVGDGCVLKNTRIIKDVRFGPACYVKGANKLKNLTVNSSEDEPTQIGEGVELVNGIIGLGCHIFYGCKAVRFVMSNNSSLKYGARLIHSFMGDNSTVSCCEMLNNLIFPAHEQHHNNSFLIAACLMGQSNLAAGATVGSNHNSRANDNEIQAGRGFWPGLCTTIKHSSRFASFCLLAKGDYPAELNIPLPFALLNNNVALDRLEVMPAFWWLHNMYALARNTWKFQSRDKRRTKTQNIEFDSLAPDTAEEMLGALRLLERWTAQAKRRADGLPESNVSESRLAAAGRKLLTEHPEQCAELEILGENMEKTRRKVVILKAADGYRAYRQMLHYYAVKNLLEWMQARPKATLATMRKALAGRRVSDWINLGGQLAPAGDVDRLRKHIRTGKLPTWDAIHAEYDRLWEEYPLAKQRHAYAVLLTLLSARELTAQDWRDALDEAVSIQKYVRDEVYASRQKDFENPFRRATFLSEAEMTAVNGTAEGNSFVKQVREETRAFVRRVGAVKRRG
ncbi:MAG: DUF4954 family protein [Armatimonadia bacterium]|nr:DUF4954 family protein [Armatimonadia bacterium]